MSTCDVFNWQAKGSHEVSPALIQAIAEITGSTIDHLTVDRGSSQLSSELRDITQTARFKDLATRWAHLRNTSADLAASALTARLETSVHRGAQPDVDQMLNSLDALGDRTRGGRTRCEPTVDSCAELALGAAASRGSRAVHRVAGGHIARSSWASRFVRWTTCDEVREDGGLATASPTSVTTLSSTGEPATVARTSPWHTNSATGSSIRSTTSMTGSPSSQSRQSYWRPSATGSPNSYCYPPPLWPRWFGAGPISARHVSELVDATRASRPACAIALASRLAGLGAVVIIDKARRPSRVRERATRS